MRDQLNLIVAERTENHARIVLAPRDDSGIAQISGVVRGPYSDFSKTLTSDSEIKVASDGSYVALVVEPCYWTPNLPFWYDLRLTVTLENGTSREEVISIGIKRFYCEQRNFLLEGKRVVLRGMSAGSLIDEEIITARKYETALIVKNITEQSCAVADRLGVPLVIDLRGDDLAMAGILDWHAAVMLVLIDANQVDALDLWNTRVAVCSPTDSGESIVRCDAYAVELEPGDRPPTWAAICDKPVIAIRKDSDPEIRTARANCDKLQAELAPEFDLAGYFV